MTDDLDEARRRKSRRITPPAGTYGLTGSKQAAANRVLAKVDAAAERRDPGAGYAGLTPTRERITAALNIRMLYGPEVDRALGGEEPMVDEWEAGKRIPTFEQVQALSELTSLPVKFFYLPPPEPFKGGWVCGPDGCRPLDGADDGCCPTCGGTGVKPS